MKFWTQFWLLLLFLGVGIAVLLGLSMLLMPLSTAGHTVAYFHIVQWIQTLLLMIAAPMCWVWYVYQRKKTDGGNVLQGVIHELLLDRFPLKMVACTFCLMLCSIPLLEMIEVWSSRMPLTDSMLAYCEEESLRNVQTLNLLLSPTGIFAYLEFFLLMCLGTAIGEEIMFRGALLNCLRKGAGLHWHVAALVVGLIFALIHFELLGLVVRWMLGTFFVYLVYWSRSLWPAILAHCMNNLFALISYKISTPEKLLQVTNQEFSFSGPMYVASIVACAAIIFVMWNQRCEKEVC